MLSFLLGAVWRGGVVAVAGLIVPRAVVAVVPAVVLMASPVAATGWLAAAIVVVAACSG